MLIKTDDAVNLCLQNMGYKLKPEYLDIRYIDELDFFNLTDKEIPEEFIKFPVITHKEDEKFVIYVNYNQLAENEYYVLEIMLAQIIKVIMQKEEQYVTLKQKCKNTFFQKEVESGLDIFLEYQELCIVMKTMEKLYNSKEYTYQKQNPYILKQNKKLTLKILKNTIKNKNGDEKLSSIIYCLARMSNKKDYVFNDLEDDEAEKNINELNSILKQLNLSIITKQDLNKLGMLGKVLA